MDASCLLLALYSCYPWIEISVESMFSAARDACFCPSDFAISYWYMTARPPRFAACVSIWVSNRCSREGGDRTVVANLL